jgi:hypothetical protein
VRQDLFSSDAVEEVENRWALVSSVAWGILAVLALVFPAVLPHLRLPFLIDLIGFLVCAAFAIAFLLLARGRVRRTTGPER